MEFKAVIFDSLKFIEKNISEPITAEDIAKNAGYSLYYYSRMFKKQMGLSIMEYVKDRRLIKASEEILNSKKIIDVALEYNQERIKKAYELACSAHDGKKRYSGDAYVTHSINVAILLSEMESSEDAVLAGLLHDIFLENSIISLDEVRNEFSVKYI